MGSNSTVIVIVRVKVSQEYGGVCDSEPYLTTALKLSDVDSVATDYAVLEVDERRTPEQLQRTRRDGYSVEMLRRTFGC